MQRNIECIADVLVLIAGSERLLAIIREQGIYTILKEDKILTRLGWCRDPDGTMRWRIEVVDDEQTKVQPIRLGSQYTPVPDSVEDGAQSGSSDDESPLRVSVEIQSDGQSLLHGTSYSSVSRHDDGDDEEDDEEEVHSIVSSVDMLPAVGSAPSTEISPIETSADFVPSSGVA